MRSKLITMIMAVAWMGMSCVDTKFKGHNSGANHTGSKSDLNPNPIGPGTIDPNGNTQYPGGGGSNNPNPGGGTGFDGIWKGGTGLDFGWGGFNESWQIGDNQADVSTCKFAIEMKVHKGSTYAFNFRVLHDGTQLGIKFNICGTDFPGVNTARLLDASGNIIHELKLPVAPSLTNYLLGINPVTFPNRITLNQGWYKLKVEAGTNPYLTSDKDDFIVGRVKIVNPSKDIQKGDVTAN